MCLHIHLHHSPLSFYNTGEVNKQAQGVRAELLTFSRQLIDPHYTQFNILATKSVWLQFCIIECYFFIIRGLISHCMIFKSWCNMLKSVYSVSERTQIIQVLGFTCYSSICTKDFNHHIRFLTVISGILMPLTLTEWFLGPNLMRRIGVCPACKLKV